MTEKEHCELISYMILAAKRAAHEIMCRYRGNFNVREKDDRTPVSDADIAASNVITAVLHEHFPHAYILCEETYDVTDPYADRCSDDGVFIVDPLDGTRAFIEGRREFAVSIAYAVRHIGEAAVILAPALGKLYYAARGRGAWRIDNPCEDEFVPFDGKFSQRLAVSERSSKLILLIGNRDDEKALFERGEHAKSRVGNIVRVSSCLKGCMIAEGEADVHYKFAEYTKEWDTAAEELLCREAGGVVTDAYGGELYANREDIANRHGIRLLNKASSHLFETF